MNLNNITSISKYGQQLDRQGLTRTGRALDKHGNRPGCSFPKASGNTESKNIQGQFQLDDILTDPQSKIYYDRQGSFEIYSRDGRGAEFKSDSTFKGFVEFKLRGK